MSTEVRSVVTRFDADIDGYLAKVAKMRASARDLEKEITRSAGRSKSDGFDKLGASATVMGAVIGAAVIGATATFARFDKEMSGVSAALDDGTRSAAALTREKAALSEAAIKAGQDTVFSATEAAKAEAELARAGVGTADILGGALRGSLDLAAAGQVSLEKSAEVTAQALNIFNLEGDKASHVADVLTAGANKSAAGVDDMALALQQGGLVAKQTGLTLEDTVGVLAAYADNALKGSDAGTSFKTMLQRLTPQSEEQAKAMKQLGLDFYDARGNFVGIDKVAGQLQTSLGRLTQEQRNAALTTIFGSDAVRGATVLYEQGEAGIRKYIAGVDDAGAAQRAASRQTDNLTGDIEQLKGTLESAFIRGGAGGNDGLRDLVQNLTSLIDKFNELDPETQATVVKIAAATAGVLLLAGGTVKAVRAVTDLRDAVAASNILTARSGTILTTGGKAAAKFAAALAATGAALDALQDPKDFDIQGLVDQVIRGANPLKALNDEIERTSKVAHGSDFPVRNLGDALHEAFAPGALNQVQGPLTAVLNLFGGNFATDQEQANQQLANTGKYLGELVTRGRAKEAAEIFRQLSLQSGTYGRSTQDLLKLMPAYQDALDGATVAVTETNTATGDLGESTSTAAAAVIDAATATKTWTERLDALNSPLLDARAAARQVEQAVDDATESVKKNGQTLDINGQAGRDNADALDSVAEAMRKQIVQMRETGASQKGLTALLGSSRERLYDVALQFGLTKRQAQTYVNQVLKVPAAVKTTVTADTTQATPAIAAVKAQLDSISGRTIKTFINVVTTGANTASSTTGGLENLLLPRTRRAQGGAVWGAGTATSDSIAAYLSNGEYVVKAAAVARYGVHFFDHLNAMRFATGGPVATPAYRGSAPGASYVTNGPSSYSESYDSSLYAENVTIVADDPRSFRRDLRGGTYQAKARPGRR